MNRIYEHNQFYIIRIRHFFEFFKFFKRLIYSLSSKPNTTFKLFPSYMSINIRLYSLIYSWMYSSSGVSRVLCKSIQ